MKVLNKTIVNNENNYGQRLQCYALQKFISNKLKIDIDTYDDRKLWCSNKYNAFEKFESKYLSFIENINLNNYDLILVGSDQIWNRNWLEWQKPFYQKNNCKLVSYAASANGTLFDNKNQDVVNQQMNMFSNFDAISFREIVDAKECERNRIKYNITQKIESHIDPVFLLTLDEWKTIMKKPSFVKDGEIFILRYIFQNKPNEKLEKDGIVTYSIYGHNNSYLNGGKDIFQPSPDEFLWMVANCQKLETYSFHGTVLGFIFNKKFTNIIKNDLRINNVIDMLNIKLKDNKVNNYDEMVHNIKKQRRRAYNWLKECLSYRGFKYVCRLKNKILLDKCASGGVSAALASKVIEQGGIVYGAAYSEDFKCVKSIYVDNIDDYFKKIAKSKYSQCQMPDLEVLKKQLEDGELVLFTGCPCQVRKLKEYLGKNYMNLLTVDLICNGSSKSVFLEKFINEQETTEQSNVVSLDMRPMHQSFCKLKFANSKEKDVKNIHGYFVCNKDNYIEECKTCKKHPEAVCNEHRETCADLTVGDTWTYKKFGLDESWNPCNGNSIVVINSETGRELFNSVKLLFEYLCI